ncbi:MAG: hypothetical protein KBS41_00360, partial [Oscillospiraceae bacterium]|nr:hypothetical protein [Candidatus Equicaccousia limihippi]
MVEKMQMVNIVGPEASLDDILSVCMDAGCFDIEETGPAIYKAHANIGAENPYGESLAALTEILGYYDMQPQLIVPKHSFKNDEAVRKLEKTRSEHHELIKERDADTSALNEIDEKISNLRHFCGLEFDISAAIHSKFIKVRFGRISVDSYSKLNKYTETNPYVLFTPCSREGNFYWGVYTAPTEWIDAADRIFSVLFFERMNLPDVSGSPDKLVNQYEKEREELRQKLDKTVAKLDEYHQKNGDRFLELYTYLKRGYDIYEYRKYAVEYKDKFIMLTGWVPQSDYDRFCEMLQKVEDTTVMSAKAERSQNLTPPTKLKNKALFKPFGFFVNIYGTPGYNEIDPTPFLAITYTLLYGIMFADLGQGIVLALVGLWMYKVRKMELGLPLIPCGIAGAVFGLVFGSFFGYEYILDPMYRMLGFAKRPFPVMENAINLLLISVGIGIALTVVAMIIGIVANFKKKNIAGALFGPNGVAGTVFYISLLLIIGSLILGWNLPISVIIIFGIILPVILIFFKEPLGLLVQGKKVELEGIGDFILENFFELFEVLLGYFTNTISFLRVGAFVLIH